jgi:hypothetical protein
MKLAGHVAYMEWECIQVLIGKSEGRNRYADLDIDGRILK